MGKQRGVILAGEVISEPVPGKVWESCSKQRSCRGLRWEEGCCRRRGRKASWLAPSEGNREGEEP